MLNMLRKTKSANIVKALVIITILTISLVAIQVQGQQNQNQQQRQENERQGPGGLISPQGNQTLALCGNMRLLLINQPVYTRLVLVAFHSNAVNELNATYAKLLTNAELLGNASQLVLGPEASQNLTTLLKTHDQIYLQILNQTRENDTQALNASVTLWYENAAQIAALLNATLFGGNQTMPGGNMTIFGGNQTMFGGPHMAMWGCIQAMQSGNQTGMLSFNTSISDDLNTYLNITLREVKEEMRGNFSAGLRLFDEAESTFLLILMKMHLAIHANASETTSTATTTITKTTTITLTSNTCSSCSNTSTTTVTSPTTTTTTVTSPTTTTKTVNQTITSTSTTTVTSPTTTTKTITTTIISPTTITSTVTVTQTNTTTTTTNTTTTTTNTTQLAVISILNGSSTNRNSTGYMPDNITVVVGVNNTIMWTDNDTKNHKVDSTEVPDDAEEFKSDVMKPGETFTITLTVPGTYHYRDNAHKWMNGTIIVKGP